MPQSRKPKFGRIYKKFNKNATSGEKVFHSTWTLRFHGRDHATGTSDYKIAERQLLKLIGESAHEKRREALGASAVLISDLLELVQQDYQRESRANFKTVDGEIRLHLGPKLGHRRALDISSAEINGYKDARLKEKASKATINCELAVLMRGFSLAVDQGRLTSAPPIKKLTLDNVRTGFITPEQYRSIQCVLPDHLKPMLCVAYHVGNRKGELLSMKRSQVDLEHCEITLDPGSTKNREGRTAPIYGDMVHVLTAWLEATQRDYPNCPWLFHNAGEAIQSFRKAWASACTKAGLKGLLFHDLRCSAVRNLTRAGVPRPVSMQITGHKTESIYRRYDIVDSSDIKLAGKLLDAFMKPEYPSATGSLLGS